MPYLYLIDEAIGLLNTEIRLIEWHIKYPEQLQQPVNKQALPPLFLADKTTLINIMEMVSGLFLSKEIVYLMLLRTRSTTATTIKANIPKKLV